MRTIGIIGPQDSVARIMAEAVRLHLPVTFLPFVYDEVYEAPAIIRQHQASVSGWLFSGPTPYMIAVDKLGPSDSFVYCPFTEAGLYRCFLQLAQERGPLLSRLSLDFPGGERLQESLDELGLPLQDSYLRPFDSDVNITELIQFHLRLWQEGKIDGAISSVGSVYHALKQNGVPVYRNTVTAMSIRSALQFIAEKVTATYFKDTQVSFQIIEVDKLDAVYDKPLSPFDVLEFELSIKRELIRFCRKMNGYLIEKGRGRYEIFSSRGAVERTLDALHNTVYTLSQQLDTTVSVGIGYGDSVVAAETNARKALANAKSRELERIVILQEDGVLIESAGSKNALAYASQSQDQALLEKLRQVNVSIKTYRKIEAIVRNLGWSVFTAAQLASELSSTERHVRRLLAALMEAELVGITGEESAANRGRPSKLYRLNAR